MIDEIEFMMDATEQPSLPEKVDKTKPVISDTKNLPQLPKPESSLQHNKPYPVMDTQQLFDLLATLPQL